MWNNTGTKRNKAQKETRQKYYKTIATSVLMYEWESWVYNNRNKSKIHATDMNKSDRIKNEDIRQNIFTTNDKIEQS